MGICSTFLKASVRFSGWNESAPRAALKEGYGVFASSKTCRIIETDVSIITVIIFSFMFTGKDEVL